MRPQLKQRTTDPRLVETCDPDANLPAANLTPLSDAPKLSRPAFELDWKRVGKITGKPISRWLALLSVLCIPLVGFADYASGPGVSVAFFYILPVATAAWFGGRRLSLIAAFVSAATWFTAGTPVGSQHSTALIHFWNATSRLLVCSLVAYLFSSLRKQRDGLQTIVQENTALLAREIAERARVQREVIDICAREQRRIAYDLHDNLGQHLVGIAVQAKVLEEKLRPASPAAADQILEIVRLTNKAAKQVRLTAGNLDGAEGVGDLRTALQKLAADVRHNCRISGWVKANVPSLPVSTPVAVQLYRIAQEAVHNAVEHGEAKEVQIDLASDDKEIVLTVRDNGHGFNANAITHGLGLRIMRYRAQCIGGSCEIQSRRGAGTIITCRVALPLGGDGNSPDGIKTTESKKVCGRHSR
jgi:signal transduction histidine kinase